MYNQKDHDILKSLSNAYKNEVVEGFKDFPEDKVKNQEKGKSKDSPGPEQARKMKIARLAHTDPDLKGMAQGAVKNREKDNKLTGQKKALGRAYDNSGEKADDDKLALKKKTLEAALKKDSKGHPNIEEEAIINAMYEAYENACNEHGIVL